MKNRSKNILGYGALLSGGLLLGSAMMAGIYSLHAKSIASPMNEAKSKEFNESMVRYAEQLQISNNARDIAVASLILDLHDMLKVPVQSAKPMHIEQLRRAIALSPDDADIAWLEAMGCGRLEAACNREQAVVRLEKLEPDNLAVHLFSFNQAEKAGDDARRFSALQAMANSRYSDIHYSSLGNMWFGALRGWHSPRKLGASEIFGDDMNQEPVTDDEARKIVAAGYSLAIGLPALQQFTSYCNNEKLPANELQYCQRIATLMVADKTLIMHSIGLRLGVETFKEEPAGGQWREAYRAYYWQSASNLPDRGKKYSERKYLNAWPNVDEVEQQKQRLIDRGISLTPPDGWMPASAEIRQLLKAPVATNP